MKKKKILNKSKANPKKKKKTQKQASQNLFEKPEHLDDIEMVLVRRYAEIIPVLSKQKMINNDLTNPLPKRIVFDTENEDISTLDKVQLSSKIELGLKLRKFIKTRKEKIAIDIIKSYPEIIFEDEAKIGLYLLLTGLPSSDGIYSQPFTKSLTFDKSILYCSIKNPIKEQILLWSFLSRFDTPEGEKAKKYLRNAGLGWFVHSGRPRNIIAYAKDQKQIKRVYRDLFGKLQELYKSKPRFQADRQKLVKQAIENNQFIDEKIQYRAERYRMAFEFGKNKLIENWSNVYPARPSNIALTILADLLEVGLSTIKAYLYPLKNA